MNRKILEEYKESVDWLLELDEKFPSVRYLVLKDLLGKREIELENERRRMLESGIIPEILQNQHPDGYWEGKEDIYRPKYRATTWQLILLVQMGAKAEHPQIEKAGEFILNNALTPFGALSVTKTQSGCAHCLQGNWSAALIDLGFENDNRLLHAVDWMARSVIGEGFSESQSGDFRYRRSGISGPGFLCSANDHQPCAWGAVKVALALSKVSEKNRTEIINQAIESCKAFLLSADPASAEYPHPYSKKTSGSWFKFGFPVFYVTDVLQNLEALTALGLCGDSRLKNAVEFVEGKKTQNNCWNMEYSYNGKMWVDIEEKGKPSKWVTYRALKALKDFYQ